ncbi:hypothetical protein B0A54_14872 [Friedmanniomyces endolithicus]|uniref:Aminoglycoside phosphotransferase domain-containing protein n=1 Tax=Friedmanniomyces endolithicus TaxID=329885 RepID=A0A4U0UHI0_9PEZI|nr:hypothetical protein B0A54_14872 [Friedmanniomyces endolithicus]
MLDWQSSEYDFQTAADCEVIESYEGALPLRDSSPTARRVASTVVIKRVTVGIKEEYANLFFAWSLLDGTRMRVPKPLRLVQSPVESGPPLGYLVMGYLDGRSLDSCHGGACVRATADAVRFLHTHYLMLPETHVAPGPLGGGCAEDFPWGQDGAAKTFVDTDDLEQYANVRLSRYASDRSRRGFPSSADASHRQRDWNIKLQRQTLTLCHMDLSPRNILYMSDGTVGILDWSSLALYPVIFELASLSHCLHVGPLHERAMCRELLAVIKGFVTSPAYEAQEIDEDIAKLEALQSMSIRHAW